MQPRDSSPQEGGVKIVFDVPEADMREIALVVSAAGFQVHRYYHPDDEHNPGGSPLGSIRLGAERPKTKFNRREYKRIVADFEVVREANALECTVIGVDEWTSGGGPDLSGDREPRTPPPEVRSGTAPFGPASADQSLLRNWGRSTDFGV